jgi:hypothetical protein
MPWQNQRPTLSGGGVNPPSGDTTDDFTFSVTYTDSDNDAPTAARVIIDGTPHDMTGSGTTYSSGVTYNYTTTLSAGSHTFRFEFNDGTNHIYYDGSGVRKLPEQSTFVGPVVAAAGDITPPTQVMGLSSGFSYTESTVKSNADFTKVALSWSPATDTGSGVSYYKIWRNGALLTTATGTAYNDTSTSEATRYLYEVSAVDGAGNEGAKSVILNISTGPLFIASVTPGRYAVNVPTTTSVTVVFNIDVDEAKTEKAFQCYTQPAGPYVYGTFSWPNAKTLVFTPTTPLNGSVVFYTCAIVGAPDRSRDVAISPEGHILAARDYGNKSVLIWGYIWSFTNAANWPNSNGGGGNQKDNSVTIPIVVQPIDMKLISVSPVKPMPITPVLPSKPVIMERIKQASTVTVQPATIEAKPVMIQPAPAETKTATVVTPVQGGRLLSTKTLQTT